MQLGRWFLAVGSSRRTRRVEAAPQHGSTDQLTGLATRAGFSADLVREHARARAGGGQALVLLVDVDGLKEFNDRIGHAAVDALLAEVARRLRDRVGERGVVARFGGDEFAILLHSPAGDPVATSVGLRRAVAIEPILTEGRRCAVEVSVGWALLDGREEPETVLRQADEQMYLAKRRAGSDPFDRVSELVIGLLAAGPRGAGQALASGVAEVAQAEVALLVHRGSEQWWPAQPGPQVRERLRTLARSAQRADDLVEGEGWSLGVPLRGDGAVVGGFAVCRRYPFGKPDRVALARCGVAIGQALRRLSESEATRRRITELEHLAFRDENTGLANRRALIAALAEHETTEPLSVLFLDFDGLRQVNNALSYEHGNELLRSVAKEIERALRPGELAARLHGGGGDEFIVVCPHLDEADAALRAEALERGLMDVDLPAETAALYGGASVGHAVRRPDEAPLELFERAAVLMRARKQRRKYPAAPG